MSSQPFDSVRVTVTVRADPAAAFAVFTAETDLWWRRGPKFRASGTRPGLLVFEPGVGGRLIETFETASGPRAVVTGEIVIWDPPARFAFNWRPPNFSAGDPSTNVEVSFDPVGAGTRVTLVHSGWSAVRESHPVRHGLDGEAFVRMNGMWWGDLMSSLRERIEFK